MILSVIDYMVMHFYQIISLSFLAALNIPTLAISKGSLPCTFFTSFHTVIVHCSRFSCHMHTITPQHKNI